MVREHERFHGIAILRAIVAAQDDVSIVKREDIGSGCFAIGGVGIQVKYATDRLSPWQFAFNAEHRAAQDRLSAEYGSIGVLLVCNEDGVIVLNALDLEALIGRGERSGTIAVYRKPREMAQLRGTAGDLTRKMKDSDFSRLGGPF